MKNWEEMDYYDSDEDTFLDRTGESELKYMEGVAQSFDGQLTMLISKNPEFYMCTHFFLCS